MKKLVCALAILLSYAAIAADVFDDQKPRVFKLAEPLELDATIGGYPIWKGEGKWRLFDIIRRDSTGGSTPIPIGEVDLFQTEGKKFIAVMTVTSNLAGGSTKWLGEPCKRDDMLFKANLSKSVWQDNCVTINHIANYANNPSGGGIALYALLKEQGIEFPPTVLQVRFTRNGTSGNFLNTVISINPEVLGFARESEVNWSRNPWNKSMSFSDPAKKQLIDALGVWALQFANHMDEGLDKKLDAFSSIPSWRTVLAGVPTPEAAKPRVMLD